LTQFYFETYYKWRYDERDVEAHRQEQFRRRTTEAVFPTLIVLAVRWWCQQADDSLQR